MNMSVLLSFLSVLFATTVLTTKSHAQSLEQKLVADIKALGYNVEKTENGNSYHLTENGGLYDDNHLSLYVGVYKRGVHEYVSVVAPIGLYEATEKERISNTSSRLMARNVYVPCAKYSAYYDEDGCYFNLAREIERGCYSKGLLGDVITCIKSELQDQASDARGYQLNKSEIDEVNQLQRNLIKDMRTKANKGKK